MEDKLPTEWAGLLATFRRSDTMDKGIIIDEIHRLDIDADLKSSLAKAISGDNRPLNRWMFSRDEGGQLVAWIAPIRSDHRRFAWMIGKTSTKGADALKLFRQSRLHTKIDPLLRQTHIPPELLFVEPMWVSEVQPRSTGVDPKMQDEFAIFQVGYKDAPVEVSDFEQRMLINVTHIVYKRKEALVRLNSIAQVPKEVMDHLSNKLDECAIIHTEGHNQAHFLGAWVFEADIKKRCAPYEAVEEFRACLGSMLIAEHMALSEAAKDAIAASIFIARFLGYGYEAWLLPRQRRETAREITVGLMFFEWLLQNGAIAIHQDSRDVQLSIDFHSIRPLMKEAFRRINAAEERATQKEVHLRDIAKDWYQLAFPGATYSEEALLIYNSIRKAEQ